MNSKTLVLGFLLALMPLITHTESILTKKYGCHNRGKWMITMLTTPSCQFDKEMKQVFYKAKDKYSEITFHLVEVKEDSNDLNHSGRTRP